MRDLQAIKDDNAEACRAMAAKRRLAWERELAAMHRKANEFCRNQQRAKARKQMEG